MIRKVLVGNGPDMKEKYSYLYFNWSAHKAAAGLSQAFNNFMVWNYLIQRFTAADQKAHCWSDREKLFSFSASHHKDSPTKVRMHLSLEITELSLELFKQQEVPMGRDEQQNTKQKQSIC